MFAHLRERYSGTAQRTSQKIICSELACHKEFIIFTLDIEKAFLQGLTTEEVAAVTGKDEAPTHFALPRGAAAILRQTRITTNL